LLAAVEAVSRHMPFMALNERPGDSV